MVFVFEPAVYRSGLIFRLPRPVTTLRVQEAWDFERLKVPLAAGDQFAGHSRQGVDILIDGQFGTQDGALKASEAEMFDALQSLREHLDVSAADDRFELFLYLDEMSGTYRKFKECSAVRLEYDLSSSHLFTYAAVLHAGDPTIYTTAPGV